MSLSIVEHEDEATESICTVETEPIRRRLTARRTLAVLPTLCTLGNCLCGFLVIFFASRNPEIAQMPWQWTPLTLAAVFVFVGMIFDGLDGQMARKTGRTSNWGAQLDSMADMVTFGVAPAFLAVQLVGIKTPFVSESGDPLSDRVALVIACIYVTCAALRLARFNIAADTEGPSAHMYFEGLPSPGAAGTVASLVLLHERFLANYSGELLNQTNPAGLATPWPMQLSAIGMVLIMMLTALAMVGRLQYVHVLNRYLRERAPIEYIAILMAIGLLVMVHVQGALAAGLVAYALSAPVSWIVKKIGFRGRGSGFRKGQP